jgi:hypothetical protein
MKFRASLPLMAAAVGVLSIVSSAVRADDAVTLKYTDKAGTKWRHQIVIKASVQGIDAIMTSVQSSVIKDVKDSGEITLVQTDEGGTLSLMGNDQRQEPRPDITIKRDKTGKITSWKPATDITGALPPELLQTTDQFYTTIFPTMPVKEKETWKLELENPMFKAKKINITNTFAGIEKVDGVDLWKITQVANVPTDGEGGLAVFEGTFWLNPASGLPAKIEGKAKDVPSQFGKLSFTVNITPAKAAAAPAPDKAGAPK